MLWVGTAPAGRGQRHQRWPVCLSKAGRKRTQSPPPHAQGDARALPCSIDSAQGPSRVRRRRQAQGSAGGKHHQTWNRRRAR